MITPLEKYTVYRLGLGEDARTCVYLGRYFPEDHPPVFQFQDLTTEEVHEFALPQLTAMEKAGGLRIGDKHIG